jgi:hypothetical protein
MNYCSYNNIINFSYKIFFQVCIIFIFLTLFFFNYVTYVERTSFKDQLNLIVDDIFSDIDINSYNIKNKDELFILINSYLELQRQHIKKDSSKTDYNIQKQNESIFKKSLIYVTITSSILLVITVVLLSIDSCVIYFQSHIFYAVIGLLLVAATEYLFLNLISKKYYSVDPGLFRRNLSLKIKQWLKTNKKYNKYL